MTIPDFEKALLKAKKRASKNIQIINGRPQVLDFDVLSAAHETVLQAERDLAAAKGEPYAVPIKFPVEWDTGAPMPYLFCDDNRVFLTFFVRDIDPNWDGTYVTIRNPGSGLSEKLAVVEFERCICTKMGNPNEEVLHGHPLSGKGLEGYRALSVVNSPWIKELEAINSVHSCYKAEYWRDYKHYILPFHDSTFECVARGFKVEEFLMPLPDLLAEICKRLAR
jgi:hypothetical protein